MPKPKAVPASPPTKNGVNKNLSSWYSTGYSDKYVVSGGNRYGFN